MDAGVPIPANAIAPEVPAHLIGYIGIFWKLHTCRAIGFSAGPIPWTAIDKYAERHGMLDDETLYDDLIYIIMAMDQSWLSQVKAEESKKEKASSGPQSNLKPTW